MSYGSFNAQDFKPNNGGSSMHPIGIFAGTISNAEILPTKEGDGGYYAVTMKSNVGEVVMRYNLWNQNSQAVEIARGQLSALCHAINFYQLNFDTDGGRALVGAPVMFKVDAQLVPSDPNDKRSVKVSSPTLTQVTKVYSSAGVDPSAPSSAPVVPTEGAATQPQPAAPAAPAPAPFPQTTPAPAPSPAPASAAAPAPAPSWQQGASPALAAGATAKPPWQTN